MTSLTHTTGREMYPALEKLERSELRALQLRRLNRLLERLWASNPFYQRLWREAGLSPGELGSLDAIRNLPVISKQDLLADQAARPPYGTRLGVPDDQVFEITLSSGTSGNTQEVHPHTARDAHLRGALHAIAFWWAGGRPGDLLSHHVGVSNSASHGSFHRGFRALGSMPYLIGYAGFEKRIELMQTFGVDVMYVMPSALNGLTQLCEQRGKAPRELFPDLRSMVMSGEAWPIDFILRMEEAWGAPIFEGYGASQTYGCFIMSNCELGAVQEGTRGALHMYEWAALLEVLHPETLEPVGPGEAGELVVTLLEKEASPLVRFRTRDKVVYHPWTDCSCGRQLDFLEAGTISRWDDMLKIKGENVFPNEVDEIVFARPEIGEYQARVFIGSAGRDVAEMQVGLAEEVRDVDALLGALREELKRKTNVSIDLRQVPLESLPQWTTPDIKPRRWTDERQQNLKGGGA
jgi:phenylacetate-CoA ligase